MQRSDFDAERLLDIFAIASIPYPTVNQRYHLFGIRLARSSSNEISGTFPLFTRGDESALLLGPARRRRRFRKFYHEHGLYLGPADSIERSTGRDCECGQGGGSVLQSIATNRGLT